MPTSLETLAKVGKLTESPEPALEQDIKKHIVQRENMTGEKNIL
jgi:hypothetical protein